MLLGGVDLCSPVPIEIFLRSFHRAAKIFDLLVPKVGLWEPTCGRNLVAAVCGRCALLTMERRTSSRPPRNAVAQGKCVPKAPLWAREERHPIDPEPALVIHDIRRRRGGEEEMDGENMQRSRAALAPSCSTGRGRPCSLSGSHCAGVAGGEFHGAGKVRGTSAPAQTRAWEKSATVKSRLSPRW